MKKKWTSKSREKNVRSLGSEEESGNWSPGTVEL